MASTGLLELSEGASEASKYMSGNAASTLASDLEVDQMVVATGLLQLHEEVFFAPKWPLASPELCLASD